MSVEKPKLKVPYGGDVLCRAAERYPALDVDAIRLSVLIRAVARYLSADINRRLADYGISEAKMFVIAYLFSEDLAGHKSPTPSDIAENLDVTRGTITGLLDGLEADGYIQRVRDSSDRRAVSIRMTEKASRFMDDILVNSAIPVFKGVDLDEREKDVMTRCLERIARAFHAGDHNLLAGDS